MPQINRMDTIFESNFSIAKNCNQSQRKHYSIDEILQVREKVKLNGGQDLGYRLLKQSNAADILDTSKIDKSFYHYFNSSESEAEEEEVDEIKFVRIPDNLNNISDLVCANIYESSTETSLSSLQNTSSSSAEIIIASCDSTGSLNNIVVYNPEDCENNRNNQRNRDEAKRTSHIRQSNRSVLGNISSTVLNQPDERKGRHFLNQKVRLETSMRPNFNMMDQKENTHVIVTENWDGNDKKFKGSYENIKRAPNQLKNNRNRDEKKKNVDENDCSSTIIITANDLEEVKNRPKPEIRVSLADLERYKKKMQEKKLSPRSTNENLEINPRFRPIIDGLTNDCHTLSKHPKNRILETHNQSPFNKCAMLKEKKQHIDFTETQKILLEFLARSSSAKRPQALNNLNSNPALGDIQHPEVGMDAHPPHEPATSMMAKQVNNTIRTFDLSDARPGHDKYPKNGIAEPTQRRGPKNGDIPNKNDTRNFNKKDTDRFKNKKTEDSNNFVRQINSNTKKPTKIFEKVDTKKANSFSDDKNESSTSGPAIDEHEKLLRSKINAMNPNYLQVIRMAPAAVRKKLLLEKNGELVENIYRRQEVDLEAERLAKFEQDLISSTTLSNSTSSTISDNTPTSLMNGAPTPVPSGTLSSLLNKASNPQNKFANNNETRSRKSSHYETAKEMEPKIDEEASKSFKALIESVFQQAVSEKDRKVSESQ